MLSPPMYPKADPDTSFNLITNLHIIRLLILFNPPHYSYPNLIPSATSSGDAWLLVLLHETIVPNEGWGQGLDSVHTLLGIGVRRGLWLGLGRRQSYEFALALGARLRIPTCTMKSPDTNP